MAASAPSCVPAQENNSAVQAGVVTVSPLAGSRDASPDTQISFLGVPAAALSHVTVEGSRTGSHSGHLRAYSEGDGASFLPSHPFVSGERVTVRAKVLLAGATHELFDQFETATPDTISHNARAVTSGSYAQSMHFHSRPDLQPPVVTVTANSPAIDPGDDFLAPYAGPGQAGPMIVEPDGQLVWFKSLPKYTSATNLQVQSYQGQPVLTWWQGEIISHGFGLGEDVIASTSYAEIAHVHAGNGHQADLHEFTLTPQGTALITAYYPILCNTASVGGSSYSGLTDGVFQEVDVKTGLVMYEWTSLDHVPLSASYASAASADTAYPFDFFHINSISVDADGSLLVSSRNTWAVYDINSQTGQVQWRLGGKQSTFKEPSSDRTAWQHDSREVAAGELSIFDNGSSPTVHPQTRGLVLSLLGGPSDTATLVRELKHVPALISESQGDLQALGNGDWFMGWGQEPYFTEFNAQGQQIYDAHLPPRDQSYRDFHFAWNATPEHPPVLAVSGHTVYASWNGATTVASWQVLAGASASSLVPVASAVRSGFETAIALPASVKGPFVAVQALGPAGEVLRSSATLRAALG